MGRSRLDGRFAGLPGEASGMMGPEVRRSGIDMSVDGVDTDRDKHLGGAIRYPPQDVHVNRFSSFDIQMATFALFK
jgi:hypothetical protein